MTTLALSLAENNAVRPFAFPVKRVINAGYTGRNTEAVKAHIAELAREGVAPPPMVPMLYPLPANSISLDQRIEVVGSKTSGEVEFVLLVTQGEVYVGMGSDHTDRELERVSVQASKQICPNILAPVVWKLRGIENHWDELLLQSWVVLEDQQSAEEKILYQQTRLATMLSPQQLLLKVSRAFGRQELDLQALDGLVLYSGTTPILTGEMLFGAQFFGELYDPVDDRKISCGYRIAALPIF
jgi:hypothetical protein